MYIYLRIYTVYFQFLDICFDVVCKLHGVWPEGQEESGMIGQIVASLCASKGQKSHGISRCLGSPHCLNSMPWKRNIQKCFKMTHAVNPKLPVDPQEIHEDICFRVKEWSIPMLQRDKLCWTLYGILGPADQPSLHKCKLLRFKRFWCVQNATQWEKEVLSKVIWHPTIRPVQEGRELEL